eukprot:3249865-Rhodomonas_salina.2
MAGTAGAYGFFDAVGHGVHNATAHLVSIEPGAPSPLETKLVQPLYPSVIVIVGAPIVGQEDMVEKGLDQFWHLPRAAPRQCCPQDPPYLRIMSLCCVGTQHLAAAREAPGARRIDCPEQDCKRA